MSPRAGPLGYICYKRPSLEELDAAVEYDLDEEGEAWLEKQQRRWQQRDERPRRRAGGAEQQQQQEEEEAGSLGGGHGAADGPTRERVLQGAPGAREGGPASCA